jgi:hypothetical protein
MPHSGSWYDIRTTSSGLITPSPRKPVVAFVGDSFWGGSDGTPTMQCGDFLLSRMLGVECYSQSFGGTGYVTAGSFDKFGSTTRVANVAKANPELIIMQGSVNDDGGTGIQTAATAAYAAYASSCPDAKIIVFGPQPDSATPCLSANRHTNIAAVKAAATAAPNVIAFHDMVGTAAAVPPTVQTFQTYPDNTLLAYQGSVWQVQNNGASFTNGPYLPGTNPTFALVTWVYTGTGDSGSPAGNGTRDTYLYSDGTHPMPGASAAFAIKEAAAVRGDLLTASQ